MFYIISASTKEASQLAASIKSYLKKQKIDCNQVDAVSFQPEKKSIIIAIGDDKFFLKAVQELGDQEVPVVAIASGESFLAQADTANWKKAIDLVTADKYHVVRKTRVQVTLNGKQTYRALNDIGLFSSKSASLIRYNLYINNEQIWKDNADGIIISTPTGSTGYSYSAHGPIVLDEPSIFSITPLSSLHKRSPLIVRNDATITIADIQALQPIIIIDGEMRIPLKEGTIHLAKSPSDALFIEFSKEYTLETKLKRRGLRKKPEALQELPPSAKLVYKTLQYEGSLTQKELISQTGLPERTVRHALELLEQHNFITKTTNLVDARQSTYSLQ